MILPEAFFDFLPWILIAGALGLAWWWKSIQKTSALQKALFSGGVVVSLILAIRAPGLGSPIVIVEFAALGQPVLKTIGRLVVPMHYKFLDGHTQLIWYLPENAKLGTIIINDSPEPLRIKFVNYAAASAIGLRDTEPTPVPRMTTFVWDTGIDQVGPDDIPPSSMTSRMSVSVNAWLTWGKRSRDE